jgi:hypothetical protein
MTRKLSTIDDINQFTKEIAKETLNLLGQYQGEDEAAVHTLELYLSNFIELVIQEGFALIPRKATKEVQYQFAQQFFLGVKQLTQDAVGNGFSNGLSKFSGQDVDYFCRITPAPMLSKKALPC